VLGYMMIDSIRTDFKTPYSGYSGSFIALGVAIAVLSIVLGWIIAGMKSKNRRTTFVVALLFLLYYISFFIQKIINQLFYIISIVI
jgi:hypothetical protein